MPSSARDTTSELAARHLQATQTLAGGARGTGKSAVSEHPLQLRAAYGVCRHIARSAAKNFYYGFLVLPARKRNALSAVYAFMRHADDISDDPSIPSEQRREKLTDWMNALRRVVEGERTDDPVLMALADTQKTFNIPLELLEKLVQGTAMDLPQAGQPAAVHIRSAL